MLVTQEFIESLIQQNRVLMEQNHALIEQVNLLNKTIDELNATIKEYKKKPTPKSLREKSGKKTGGQNGHTGKYLSVVSEPAEIVRHYHSDCANCPYKEQCIEKACTKETRHSFILTAVLFWDY